MPAKDEERLSAIWMREEALRLASTSFPGLCGGASMQMLHLMDALADRGAAERRAPEPAPARPRTWRLFPA